MSRGASQHLQQIQSWLAKSCSCSRKTSSPNLNVYRTRNSRLARRLWCTYSLPWILVKSVNVCFDVCTWKQKKMCIAHLYIISIWYIYMFLLYSICNFCQQVDCMQYNHVSGKLLAKREIWQWDKDCHVKSLTIPNLYFLNELIDRYA